MFNIISKSNNHIFFFLEKNETQISGFTVAKRALNPWKKLFSKKNLPAYYLCGYALQKSERIFLKKINDSRDI